MNTGTTWQTKSTSAADTERLGERLGSRLTGGECIELRSDLGGGKTTLVRGLARGIGSADHVSSPTFKISNEYQGKKLRLYHFDFYRLAEAGLIADELAEVIDDPRSVVIIEWADIVQNALPAEHITIQIKSLSETEREFNVSCPASLAYALKGLFE